MASLIRSQDLKRLAWVSAIMTLAAPWGAAQAEALEEKVLEVDYARDIKPVLKERCYACHGALKQRADLRLDTGALIRQGGDEGPAVIPGDPAASLLLRRVRAHNIEDRMPPEGAPLASEEVLALEQWIRQGAESPAGEEPEPDPEAHWAFLTPERPVVPSIQESEELRNPIDAFIVAARRAKGFPPGAEAEEAPRSLWLRRLYLNLVGLPPQREVLRGFLEDSSPAAAERVVDRLLASPQYGERWARHWMDVWRYSDWYGRRNVPDVWNSAPQIWRWRDWMVHSLNADQGYDQMIREMLAADEFSPEDDRAAVATGYLIRNWYALNPNDWMRNTVEHTGKAFLGLTFNCAHCHDHKYDPISQEDYFRLRAFFEPMYIRQDRVPGEADPGPFQDYEYSTLRKVQRLGAVRVFDRDPEAPTWFYTAGDERNRVEARGSIAPGVPKALSHFGVPVVEPVSLPVRAWYPGLRPAIQRTARADAQAGVDAALKALAEDRTGDRDPAALERRLRAAKAVLVSVEARIEADQARYGMGDERLDDKGMRHLARRAKRLEHGARLLDLEANVSEARAAVVGLEEEAVPEKANGHGAAPKPEEVASREKRLKEAKKYLTECEAQRAKFLEEALDPKAEDYTSLSEQFPRTSSGRRRALAKWLTQTEHPLTARVGMNHLWMRHFHAPLVATVDDFGRNGSVPTHPHLLDWLAVEWMDAGWSMKHVHRLVVTSQAYRRHSKPRHGGEAERAHWVAMDPENRFLWRMNRGRMEAEVVRDSLLHTAEALDLVMGGQELENQESMTTHRRSLYYSVYPEQGGKSALGELFDAPDALECYRRTKSIVPQQALALTNSGLVHRLSQRMAKRPMTSGLRPEELIGVLFEEILSRQPTAAERGICREVLLRPERVNGGPGESEADAIASLVRVLFNHNDFVAIR